MLSSKILICDYCKKENNVLDCVRKTYCLHCNRLILVRKYTEKTVSDGEK
jgi:hypothetical protein